MKGNIDVENRIKNWCIFPSHAMKLVFFLRRRLFFAARIELDSRNEHNLHRVALSSPEMTEEIAFARNSVNRHAIGLK